MISAVVDTNVLASGTLTAFTPPGQIINLWRVGRFELILSLHIIDELKRTLSKTYFQNHLTMQDIDAFIDLLQHEATVTPINVKIQGVATHPEDNLILAAAVSAKADYLITGDKPLLQKLGGSYNKVNLVSPADFLLILEQG